MSDLISRKALLEEMNAYKFDTVNDVARRTEHIVKSHMFELVENQPTAFDFNMILERISEERKPIPIGRMDAESYYNIGYGFGLNKATEILKSAANATNGKNGG